MPDVCGGYAITQTPIVLGPWSIAQAVGPDARPVRLSQLALPGGMSPTDRGAVEDVFERIALAAVASPTPASVLAVLGGGVDNGVLWLAEETPKGMSLADAVTLSGSMAPEQVCSFLHSLAAALEPMHAAGLYHSWLCPCNVFPEATTVRVGGWVWAYAIARLAGFAGPDVWPDAGFAAPECRAGASPSVKAEVYSAAVLAAFAVTGNAPLEAGALPGSSPALERALRIAMSSDPTLRYDGVKEMVVDVTVEQAIAMTDQAETNAVPTGGEVPDWAQDLLAETVARREAGQPLVESDTVTPAPPPEEKRMAPAAPPVAPAEVVVDTKVDIQTNAPAQSVKPSDAKPAPNAPVFEWNVGEQRTRSWVPVVLGVLSALFVLLGVAITLVHHH